MQNSGGTNKMVKPMVFGIVCSSVLALAVTARAVTIEIGSATGSPGGTVSIGATLRTMEAEVKGVAHDLAVDAKTPIVSCLMNPIFESSGVINLFPEQCEAGVSCVAARAVLAQLSNPTIADGTVLYSCDLNLALDAQGEYPVVCSNPEASDPDSGALSVTCSDGVVTAAGDAVCVGDCNLDNEVFGNEVTVCINVVAGTIELSSCDPCDANGDQEVFGNEVTIAINNLANGCE